MPTPETRRGKRRAFALLVAGILTVLLGVAIVAPLTFGSVGLRRVTFTNSYMSGRPAVSATLYTPRDMDEGRDLPAVVFAHGFTANKEVYLPLCRELAREGMIVLAVDLPGHGASGGSGDIGNTEYTALLSGYDWLASNMPAVDKKRVAAAGHSLGGVSAARAGLFQRPKKFSAVISIWCTPDLRETVEVLWGPLEKSMLTRVWPVSSYLSKAFDITSESDLQDRNVINRVDASSPPNWLLIDGRNDQFSTARLDRELIGAATESKACVPGVTYGSFEDGTARMLVLTGDDHIFEIYSNQVLGAMTEWLNSCYGLDLKSSAAFLLPRYWGLTFVVVGSFLCALAVALLCHWLLSVRDLAPVGPMTSDSWLSGSSTALRSGALAFFLLAALATLPLARVLRVRAITPPFLAGDIISSISAIQVALLLAGLVVAVLVYRRGVPDINTVHISDLLRYEALWALPALSGFIVFLLIFAPLAWIFYLGPGLPYSGVWFLLFVAFATLLLWVHGRYLHLFLLPMFGRLDTRGRKLIYYLTEGGVRALALALMLVPVLPQPFFGFGRTGTVRPPLILVLLLVGIPLLAAVSWIDLRVRARGGSLLAPSLFIALFYGWTLTAFLGAR